MKIVRVVPSEKKKKSAELAGGDEHPLDAILAVPALLIPGFDKLAEELKEMEWKPIHAFAGWLVPGLGHILAGEKTRGIVLMAAIYGMFFMGLLIGGIDGVDKRHDRLWYYGQCLAGPVAPLVNGYRESQVPRRVMQAFGPPPEMVTLQPSPSQREGAYSVSIGRTNELGMLFMTLAGMLNLLVIVDVLIRHPEDKPAETVDLSRVKSSDADGGEAG